MIFKLLNNLAYPPPEGFTPAGTYLKLDDLESVRLDKLIEIGAIEAVDDVLLSDTPLGESDRRSLATLGIQTVKQLQALQPSDTLPQEVIEQWQQSLAPRATAKSKTAKTAPEEGVDDGTIHNSL